MIDLLDDDSTAGFTRELIDQPGPQNLVVVNWAADSRQGRQRVRNEDSWAQLGAMFALADGMGGLSDGHAASALAVRWVANASLRDDELSPNELVIGANRALRLAANTTGLRSGCTLSAVQIANDQATITHVGDSRVYRVRSGQAELLTRDHNIRNELLAAGIEPKADQTFGPLRALTSYLGMPEHELQIDVRSLGLRPSDRLVLCSDGVFSEMPHRDFVSRAGSGDAQAAVEALVAHVGHDDATAVVIDVNTVESIVR